MDWKHEYQTQQVSLCPSFNGICCDCSYLSTEGMKMLNRFPGTRWPWRQVQSKLCSTIFSGNIDNSQVSCYNGKNDRAAWMMSVKHPRALGEWCNQHPSKSLAPSLRVLHKQCPHSPSHYPPKPCYLGPHLAWNSTTLYSTSFWERPLKQDF